MLTKEKSRDIYCKQKKENDHKCRKSEKRM